MIIQYVICAEYGQGDVVHEGEFDERDHESRASFAQRARAAWNDNCACVTRPKPMFGDANASKK